MCACADVCVISSTTGLLICVYSYPIVVLQHSKINTRAVIDQKGGSKAPGLLFDYHSINTSWGHHRAIDQRVGLKPQDC